MEPADSTPVDNMPASVNTEAEFFAQAEEARTALAQFASVLLFKNPSPQLVKAGMEEIMRTIVRCFYFSWDRKIIQYIIKASVQWFHQFTRSRSVPRARAGCISYNQRLSSQKPNGSASSQLFQARRPPLSCS